MEQTNNNNEIENQFILRMPVYKDGRIHPSVNKLRDALTSADSNLNNRLFIDLNTETRKAKVKFDDDIFNARLFDLPCIIESLKTFDKKTFYKTADICQLLICKPNEEDFSEDDDNNENKTTSSSNNEKKQRDSSSANNQENKKYQWLHGITPPLKNARKKRFRKVAKKKIIDYAEIEKEVKRLFKEDRDAIKVEYECINVDEQSQDEQDLDQQDGESKSSINHKAHDDLSKDNDYQLDDTSMLNSPEASNDATNMSMRSAKTSSRGGGKSYDFFVEQVIGDISSSSESEDDENDLIKMRKNNKILNAKISNLDETSGHHQNNSFLMDIGDESTNLDLPEYNQRSVFSAHDEDSNTNVFEARSSKTNQNLDSSDSSLLSPPSSKDKIKSDLNAKLDKCLAELDAIRDERRRQEATMNQITNPVLRVRFSIKVNELIQQEEDKLAEIDTIKSSLDS